MPAETPALLSEMPRHMLRQQFAAISNPAIQNHRREIRATFALDLRPSRNARQQRPEDSAQRKEHRVIHAHSANLAAVFAASRTKPQQLHQPHKFIFMEFVFADARNLPPLLRKFRLPARGNHRAAVRHKKLQQQRERNNADEDRNYHRALASKCEVTSRASSETFIIVNAHAAGSQIPATGGTQRSTAGCSEGNRLRSAY